MLIADVVAALYFASTSNTEPAVKLTLSTAVMFCVANLSTTLVLKGLTNRLSACLYNNTSSYFVSPVT